MLHREFLLWMLVENAGGHFTVEGLKKASNMRMIKVMNEKNALVDAPHNVVIRVDLYFCYGGAGGRC